MLSPETLYYHVLLKNGEWKGTLDKSASYCFDVPLYAVFEGRDFSCVLRSGVLTVDKGSEWDFATGAVDTEDMRIASLAHDAICRLHESGKIPFSYRRKGDSLFRKILEERGCSFFRRWYSYLGVSLYSYTRK